MPLPEVDIFIIGAGPAGLCAALRLQQLGYRVALTERSTVWPRAQIGEALTPGVKNIIDFLDANDALKNVPHIANLPTRLCWRSQTPEIVRHGDSAVVNRSAFDEALLQLAVQRGVQVHRPANLTNIDGCAGRWRVCFSSPECTMQNVYARIILDAQGRSNQTAQQLALAPRLSATWLDFPQHDIPCEIARLTQVEALEHGWLWGSPLPGQRYRVMVLADPATSRRLGTNQPQLWLQTQCASSVLFSGIAQKHFSGGVKMCLANPHVAHNAWQEGRLKLGDAAFALDPISSCGVEKAMRFSLQAAVAVHTYCQASDVAQRLQARDFYQQRMVETVARHHFWTASYYGQAWCSNAPFWQNRSVCNLSALSQHEHSDAHFLHIALQAEITRLVNCQEPRIRQGTAMRLHQMIKFHPEVQIAPTLCVAGNKVESLPAMLHPRLEQPLAFWENELLLPRLEILMHNTAVHSVLNFLNQSMTMQKAQNLLAWLWQRGLVEVVG